MALVVWNNLSDPYNSSQLVDNFVKIDSHDHTGGTKGLQLDGALAIQANTITSAQLGTNSVTNNELSKSTDNDNNRAVGTDNIKNEAITLGKLSTIAGSEPVTNSNIKDGTISIKKMNSTLIAHISKNTSPQAWTGSDTLTWTALVFEDTIYDTGVEAGYSAMADLTNDQINISKSGFYLATLSASWRTALSDDSRALQIRANGSGTHVIAEGFLHPFSASNWTGTVSRQTICGIYYLASGDYVKGYGAHASSGSSGVDDTELKVAWLGNGTGADVVAQVNS